MQKVKHATIPQIFLDTFEKIEGKYPTRFYQTTFQRL